MNLQPEGAVRSGARWRFVGQNWWDGGETVSGLSPGQHELEFHDAGRASEKPPNQTVNIAAGKPASVTATYQPIPGTLNVTIEPKEAVQAGAQWKVGDRPWKESGASERLPEAQHRIEMRTPPGWGVLSDPATVMIIAGQTTRATVTLRRATGFSSGQLGVRIEPQGAAIDGARWRMDGGAWQTGGNILSNVPAGPHQVEYNNVSGWVKPPSQSVTVPIGQQFNTTGTYTSTTGNVRVVISPQEAVAAGAKWRVDGGPWRDSDVSVPRVSAGQHRVEYKDVDKYVTPPPETVNVTAGGSAITTGRYTKR